MSLSIDQKRNKLNVLLVPNFREWATGTIATKMASAETDVNMLVCPYGAFSKLLGKYGVSIYKSIDVLHFMVPPFGNRHGDEARKYTTVVTSVNHVESAASIDCAQFSDHIMTLCSLEKNKIVELGLPSDQVSIVRVAVDGQEFAAPDVTDRLRIRDSLGFRASDFVVGFCAMRTSDSSGRKGLKTFETAMERAAEAIPNVAFLLMGPGWGGLAASMTHAGRKVIHVPFIDGHENLAPNYQAMDCFWVTSCIEGGPMPLLEAMACGVVPVSTRVGIAAEVVENDVNGFLVDFDSPQAFVDQTRRLEQTPALREKMSGEARGTMLSQCTWQQSADQAAEMYHLACDTKKWDPSRAVQQGRPFPGWGQIPQRQIKRWDDLAFANQLRSNGSHLQANHRIWRTLSADPFRFENFGVVSYFLRSTLRDFVLRPIRSKFSHTKSTSD